MRIEVVIEGEPSAAQLRAYAEYRLFTTLARYARTIRSVGVVLQRTTRPAEAGSWTCVVKVALEPSGCVRSRAAAGHARAAIDDAAMRIGDLMDRSAAAAGHFKM